MGFAIERVGGGDEFVGEAGLLGHALGGEPVEHAAGRGGGELDPALAGEALEVAVDEALGHAEAEEEVALGEALFLGEGLDELEFLEVLAFHGRGRALFDPDVR
ncbi:MAG: hypothetical protein M5U26_04330 [Planctomycetota bacterium]|nr:hypothetical protein [Planctomycetota bacterium]